jgi:hypothetical protein
MHSFNDSVGQAVGVCVFHNTQNEQNILSSCEHWFIPVRDIKSFQETLYRNDLEPLLTGWSDERKEYRVVLVVTTADIHLDAELLEELSNKHTMRVIRVVVGDKIKETLDKTLSEIVLPSNKFRETEAESNIQLCLCRYHNKVLCVCGIDRIANTQCLNNSMTRIKLLILFAY